MKKSMVFILIITLILSSFSFAFAENTGEVCLHVTEFNQGLPETTVQYIEGANISGSNIPLAEQSDLIIPEAKMPQTGGLGIPLFYLIGGAIAAIGIFSLIFFSLLGRERHCQNFYRKKRRLEE